MELLKKGINTVLDEEIINFYNQNKIKQPINEILSDLTYHYTSLSNLFGILSTNKIILTPSFASNSEYGLDKSKYYFLSLTTSRYSDIGYQSLTPQNLARITLNGRLLNNNYKSVRVDYWKSPKDPQKLKGTSPEVIRQYMNKHDEMEDRLVTDKSEIENIFRYIVSIDILLGDDMVSFVNTYHVNPDVITSKYIKNNIGLLNSILVLCQKNNISCHFYENKNDFNFKLTKNNINNIIKNIDVEYDKSITHGFNDDPNKIISQSIADKIFGFVLYKNDNKDKVLEKIIDFVKKQNIGKEREEILLYDINKNIRFFENKTDDFIDFINEYLETNNIDDYRKIDDKNIDFIKDYGYIEDIKQYLSNWRTMKNPITIFLINLVVLDMRLYKTTNFYRYVVNKIMK